MGRPCRRPLGGSPQISPGSSPSRDHGVLAVLQDGLGHHSNAAAFYCYQHKDQAEQLMATNTQNTKLFPLKERASIDTLVDRLGVLDLEENAEEKRRDRKRRKDGRRIKKRDNMPSGWREMQGPLMTVPEELVKVRSVARSNVKASFLCCVRADDEDIQPARKLNSSNCRPATNRQYQEPIPMNYGAQNISRPTTGTASARIQTPPKVLSKPISDSPSNVIYPNLPRLITPQSSTHLTSQTQALLSLIPPSLTPATTSALLAELSRPFTKADSSTAGYIYMFWLTPDDLLDVPNSDVASTILDAVTPTKGSGVASQQDQMLQRYSSKRRASSTAATRTVLLKIGRATNVHRRLTQWSNQCGHNITLLRYYPTASRSSQSSSSSGASQPVPFLPRVERLIHIELGERRVKQEKCESCGREHREWFEVEASRKGVKGVDECVRRWIDWGVREGSRGGRGKAGEGAM